MKYYFKLMFVLGILFLLSCANTKNSKSLKEKESANQTSLPAKIKTDTTIYISLNDSTREMLISKGKEISIQAKLAIKQALQNAIKTGGLENAVTYCNVHALPLTDSVSKAQHVRIRRIAKKYRNPLNEMNEKESKIFKEYLMGWLSKSVMYPSIIPDEQGHPVYYDPMMVESLCLNCHGKPGDEIQQGVFNKIAELYPGDKAVDFKNGDPRGMWAITFKDYVVTGGR